MVLRDLGLSASFAAKGGNHALWRMQGVFDGSHYIAIPHTTRPSRRRFRPPEEEIEVTEQEEPQTTEQEETINAEESAPSIDDDAPSSHTENEEEVESVVEKKVRSRTMTRKELFEEL